jgi:hypothetical protein
MNVGRAWEFGSHRLVLEAPDLLRVTFNGPMTFEDARAVVEIYRQVCGERPRYLVADIGRSSMDAATRKFLGTEARPEWFLGVVFIGADVLLRIVTKALLAVIFFNKANAYAVRFVATAVEAEAIIARWREEGRSHGPDDET